MFPSRPQCRQKSASNVCCLGPSGKCSHIDMLVVPIEWKQQVERNSRNTGKHHRAEIHNIHQKKGNP